jgi:hypothetical protein
MTLAQQPQVALVGMASAGKTTFVAAFWNLIQEPSANSSLRLRRLPEQAAYLTAIYDAWLHGTEVIHTSRSGGELIQIDISLSGRDLLLNLPDPSGESFDDMFLQRQLATEIDAILVAADGYMLFVRPAQLRPRVTILNAHRMGAKPIPADSKAEKADATAKQETERPNQFDPTRTPAEVQAVDLLQSIRLRRANTRPSESEGRLAVLISAWDEVVNDNLTPTQWLRARMPLLDQFLEATSRAEPYRIYGVSAQGGSYVDRSDLAAVDPTKRAFVVDANGKTSYDVAEPVAWAAHVT